MAPDPDGDGDLRIMCCSICGTPIREEDTAVLLNDPAREFEQIQYHYRTNWGPSKFTTDLEISETLATSVAGYVFVANTDGRTVTPCTSQPAPFGTAEQVMPRSATYYIPTHVHCLDIAKRVLHSRRGRLSSMRQLWKALRMRSIATIANGRVEPLARIDAPTNYQMPPLGEVVETESHWCTADVWNIPNLTASILELLKTAQAHLTPSTTAFRDRLGKLPQEMRDHIFSFMFSDRGFSSQCTYLAPQAAWMNMLLDGHTIPFLWDLDREAVERKVAEGLSTGIEWDFELLVRELCQRIDGKEGHCPSGMPDGLHNRRRIWELLEDIYVGDYLPEAACDPPVPGRARAIPRYWDEEGGSQHPLVWLRRDSAAH